MLLSIRYSLDCKEGLTRKNSLFVCLYEGQRSKEHHIDRSLRPKVEKTQLVHKNRKIEEKRKSKREIRATREKIKENRENKTEIGTVCVEVLGRGAIQRNVGGIRRYGVKYME